MVLKASSLNLFVVLIVAASIACKSDNPSPPPTEDKPPTNYKMFPLEIQQKSGIQYVQDAIDEWEWNLIGYKNENPCTYRYKQELDRYIDVQEDMPVDITWDGYFQVGVKTPDFPGQTLNLDDFLIKYKRMTPRDKAFHLVIADYWSDPNDYQFYNQETVRPQNTWLGYSKELGCLFNNSWPRGIIFQKNIEKFCTEMNKWFIDNGCKAGTATEVLFDLNVEVNRTYIHELYHELGIKDYTTCTDHDANCYCVMVQGVVKGDLYEIIEGDTVQTCNNWRDIVNNIQQYCICRKHDNEGCRWNDLPF